MARIPDDQIERLKAEVSLVRLVEAKGVTLKKVGKDYHGRCPWHDDKTPSLVISPESNLWHCLGACQMGGSVIDWVMKAEGVSFRHAAELLRNDYLPLVASETKPIKRATVPKLDAPLTSEADDQKALQEVIGFYHDTLLQSPEALAYLDSRGLNDPELVKHFRLGYANRTLSYRLPQKNRKAGAELRGQLTRIGILRAKTGHEHFNGSLVIPVIDEHGVITEVYGRKILDTLKSDIPRHLYLPDAHRGVFNVAALKASPEIILCESLIDALTFWRYGFRNVICSYGVEGFTPDHWAAFKNYGVKRVLIAYDRDEAGDRAAVALAEKLNEEGIECWRVQFPKGMDANEYALKVQPAHKSLALVLRKAEWLGQGKQPERQIDIEELIDAETLPSLAASPSLPAEATPADAPALTLPASPCPVMNPPDIPAEVTETDISLSFGDRRYRVRGLDKNHSVEQLKVNLLVHRGEAFHVDSLDLYSARQRGVYIKQAANELALKEDVLKADLGKILLKLETLQEQKLKEKLAPKETAVTVSDAERAEALALLKSPNLLQRILDDFATCGVVGEETNKLVGYLSCVSRKLMKPLAVIIQSSSAAGKSSLMDAVLQLMPEEERVQYSAMTGQSLFYMGETNLKHKILAIAEEEGAERAFYALKLLQSDGALTMASTGKDPLTGNLVTQEYRVEGPVMIFLTTTAIEIDEELLNRCIVLTVNESREQTQAIHAMQRARRTLAGLTASIEKDQLLAVHRNAQRLLRPLAVINPYADQLTFLDTKTRTRRDHEKYLTLIDSIALLHQHQRPVKSVQHKGKTLEYVEVTLDDIAQANALAHEVLGRSLDELPPQTRRLLQLIGRMVDERCKALDMARSDYRFSRKEVRDYSEWGNTQLKIHLHRLEEMEYLIVHRGGRGQSFVYELAYAGSGDEGERHLPGLIEPEILGYDGKKSGVTGEKSAPSRGQVGAKSAPGREAEIAKNAEKTSLPPLLAAETAENALLPATKKNGQSYPQATV